MGSIGRVWPRAGGPAVPRPTEPALHAGGLCAGRALSRPALEPRTDRRPSAREPRPADQPRDDLPAHLGGSPPRAARCTRICAGPRSGAGNATGATTAAAASPGNGTSASGPAIVAARAQPGHWEIDTVMGREQAALHRHPGRTQDRLSRARQARREEHGRSQPATPAVDQAGSHRFAPSPPTTAPSSMATKRSNATERSSTSPAASRLGARHQREHQRPDPTVSTQGPEHGPSHATRLRYARRASSTAAPASDSATAPRRNAMDYRAGRLTRFRGQRCTSNLMSGGSLTITEHGVLADGAILWFQPRGQATCEPATLGRCARHALVEHGRREVTKRGHLGKVSESHTWRASFAVGVRRRFRGSGVCKYRAMVTSAPSARPCLPRRLPGRRAESRRREDPGRSGTPSFA